MKNILLISTGGTIASVPTKDGLAPSVSGETLIQAYPEIKDICSVSCVELFKLDSTNMRPGHWLKIAECIENNYEKYDGFVILHGTDTMAYTAAALSYLIQDSEKPIVLTGAQIPYGAQSSDARRNLLDALFYARDERSHGVQIVFFGAVILGTRARKNYSKSFSAFSSINYPEIARVRDDQIIRFIERERTGVKFYENLNPNVGILKFVPGLRNDVLGYLIEQYDGLVIETFGVGGIPEYSDFYEQIKLATAQGKLIVLTTQVPNEGSDLSVYKVGHTAKSNLRILEAHDMTTESAFAKTMWVLGQTNDFEKAKALFYKPVYEDILGRREEDK